jgi:glycosyltransferase involved in cell wall biosynthesis
LKILLAHNYYQQSGGEDTAFRSEVDLLRKHGHPVVEYIEHNQRISKLSQPGTALRTLWAWDSYTKLQKSIRLEKPDVVHFHNIFPLISPAAYYACRTEKIPVVQSLDNPRLICPAATFFRNGHLCTDCLGKTPPWPGILYGCYHNSRLQTGVVASMLTFHRWLKTWQKKVDIFLVATEFYRNKFIEAGLPADKIHVKPHFIDYDPGTRTDYPAHKYAIFIARLDPEKGIRTMLDAWKLLPYIPLKIRGNGQLEEETKRYIRENRLDSIELIGRLSKEELTNVIRGASFLVWPSDGYYETFGYVAVESYSNGVPVIASNIGVMNEIVRAGETGLLFEPGNAQDFAIKVSWAWEHPIEMAQMGKNARREYEVKYMANRNYEMLTDVYQRAIATNRTVK